MTNEQRQAAILRHMGWSVNSHSVITKGGYVQRSNGNCPWPDVPRLMLRWPSLDSLALVENPLKGESSTWDFYCENLAKVCGGGHPMRLNNIVSATFAQRLHALCLTLNLEES